MRSKIKKYIVRKSEGNLRDIIKKINMCIVDVPEGQDIKVKDFAQKNDG